MAETPKRMKSEELLEKCNTWVESQRNLVYDEETTSNKPASDYEESYYTDSEFDSVSECGTKRRRAGVQLKQEKYDLICDWEGCSFANNHVEAFVKHVSYHIPDLKIRVRENGTEVYVCQWKACIFETAASDEISRHVNYHSYHTKLKCIGSNIRKRIKLPKCRRDSEWKNIVGLPTPSLCRWEECLKLFSNYQMFLYHVTAHTEASPRGNKVEGGVECKWTGCSSVYPSVHKLRDHMRRHTKEKLVACPDCGCTFASNAKFLVHCKRQIPIDVQGFQCSHCNKFYPTEGILRDHMRLHIFNYKCTLCDMSCESPASLARHVRYRHVSTRSFPCQLCKHAAKSQQDLDNHMSVHTTGPNFWCNYEGCLYTCKAAYSLDRHIERVHSKQVRWYCCHECPVKFRLSYRLTKHLTETHNLQLPNGHKRFQYVQDEDGCYRLQLVRYETVDEEGAPPVSVECSEAKKYSIKVNHDMEIPQVQVFEDNADEESEDSQENSANGAEANKSMPVISNILISIDDTDNEGNIIKSKFIETQETTELPLSDKPPIILTQVPGDIEN